MNVKYFPQVYKPQKNQQHPALHVCRESSRNAKHARKPLACGRNLPPRCWVMHMIEILYHNVKCALIFHTASIFSSLIFSSFLPLTQKHNVIYFLFPTNSAIFFTVHILHFKQHLLSFFFPSNANHSPSLLNTFSAILYTYPDTQGIICFPVGYHM